MSSVTIPVDKPPSGSPLPKEGDLGRHHQGGHDDVGIEVPPPEGGAPPEITADPSFFRWLRGTWVVDVERSTLPNKDALSRSDPITMTIGDAGAFTIDAPRVVVDGSIGEFVADMGLAGTMRINGSLDEQGRVPMAMDGFHITRRNLDTSGFNLPFDATFIANGIFDLLTAKMPNQALMAVSGEGGLDLLGFSQGEYGSVLTRLKVDCQVETISFIGRHKDMQAEVKAGQHKDPGIPLAAPEWIAGAFNNAVAYEKGAELSLQVAFRVSAKGKAFRLFGIDKKNPLMNFQTGVMTATGETQTVTLKAKGKLPPGPGKVVSEIIWNVQLVEDERWFWAGKSGPHRIFVTWAAPITTTSYYHAKIAELTKNLPTPQRLEFAVKYLDGKTTNIRAIAEIVQAQVNDFKNEKSVLKEPISGGKASEIDPFIANNAWALLDDDNTKRGNCGEATAIMEMVLGQLGIDACQTHVWASSKLEVLKAGLNISRTRRGEEKMEGNQQEERYCEHHKRKEALNMAFDTRPADGKHINLNYGEGCVEVEGRLYTGLISKQYDASEARPASYEALLALEKEFAREGRIVEFQVWTEPDGDRFTYCPYDSPSKDNENVKDPPGVEVPTSE
jgi:hypothetical protein